MDLDLLSLFLPPILVEHFDIKNYHKESEILHIYFCEKNLPPVSANIEKVHSKGFHKEITIQDFPIRGQKVYLHIQRRRWIDIETKKLIERDWNLVSKGTRMTEEFSSFLKEISRY